MFFEIVTTLLLFNIILCFIPSKTLSKKSIFSILILCGLILQIPLTYVTLSVYLQSILTSYLGILSFMFLLYISLKRFVDIELPHQEIYFSALTIAAGGMVFYTFALGALFFDPYRFGYEPLALLVSLSLISFFLLLKNKWLLAAILLIPMLAFHFKVISSPNLFDYYFDPLIVFCSMIWLVKPFLRKRLPAN